MFDHFIITRFNLKKEGWDASKNNTPLLTEVWMEERFALFEQFCYASLKAQHNQNFTWLVFFAEDTSEKFKVRLTKLAADFQNLKPCFVQDMKGFLPGIKQQIQASKASHIITTRLDNDDCVATTYTQEIQAQFKANDDLVIDFIDGYMLQVAPVYRLGKHQKLHNPYISRIEKNDNPQTVWDRDHGGWKRHPNVRFIRAKRIWMTVVHESNKVNAFSGYGHVNAEKALKNFAMSEETKAEIKQKLLPEKSWKGLSLKNRWQNHMKSRYKILKRFLRQKNIIK